MITGKKAVTGIAFGQVFVLKEQELKVEEGKCPDSKKELTRLTFALEKAREELREIHTKVSQNLGSSEAEIIDAHLMMLEDPEFIEAIELKISTDQLFASKALKLTSDEMSLIFESMDNDYMKERAQDIKDISSRVMQSLLGFTGTIDLPESAVLIAQELKPSVLSGLDHKKILGILTGTDGRNSHTAILARSLEIPTMMGVSGIVEKAKTAKMVAFNADEEKIYLDPTTQESGEIEQALKLWQENKKELLIYKDKKSFYQGHEVKFEANINSIGELNLVKKYGAEGVGLFRTEFIYMDRISAPNEDEQFAIYSEALKAVHPHPCTIRTLDVGGDKEIPYLKISKEENPFLGLRAIRYCLKHPEFFKIQLRALLRASVIGNLKIMIPMITTIDEIQLTKKLIKEVSAELKSKNIAVGKFKLGIMVEIPTVAIMAQDFAREVDFFSIGSNDLTQYTCAVDRMNAEVRDLYDAGNAGVLWLIENTIKAAHTEAIGVSICGEMAGQGAYTKKLLGLGLRHFSMSPANILPLRKLLS